MTKALFAGAAISALVGAVLILLSCKNRQCQRCFKGWAIFNRRTVRVCRTCRNELDGKRIAW